MAKGKKYEAVINEILDLIGGKDNIISFTHCMTRLRFNVKDKGLVQTEAIEKLNGVVGTQWANNQIQIIIGQAVNDVYDAICNKGGLKKETSVSEDLDGEKKSFSFMTIIDAITGCIVPLIPIFLASGLVKVLIVLTSLAGLLSETSSTYTVLTFASDAPLYFMPVLVGYTASKKFKTDASLAMGLTAILLYPNLVTALGSGESLTIFGMPVYATSYANMIFPSIMVVFVLSHVERLVKKFMPELIRVMMVPLLSFIIMLPLMLCLIAPAGIMLGNGVSWLVEMIYNHIGFLGVGLLAGLYPLLIITGMHSTLAPVCMSFFVKFAYDPLIIPANYLANFSQSAAALAVALKSKDKNAKGIASSSAITAFLAGVTEPALFGVTLRYKTPLIASVIGGFAGGSYVGLMGSKLVAMSGLGVFGLAGFISGDIMNLVHFIIGTAISMIVTFLLTLILFKEPISDAKAEI